MFGKQNQFSTTDKFSTMKEYYDAILAIDKIAQNEECIDKIDEVIIAVQNINKSSFDKDNTNKIISGFREALVKMYEDISSNLSDNIKIESPSGGVGTTVIMECKVASDKENRNKTLYNTNGSANFIGKNKDNKSEEVEVYN